MRDDKLAVLRNVDVELRKIDAVLHRDPKRLQRVFGCQGAGSAMTHRYRTGRHYHLSSRMIGANPYTAAGYQVLKVETHLHTLHSDGQHSVSAMFEACHSAGYDAVALTDHNTLSGLPEAEAAADRLGLVLLPGVEVTTFRGHAVVLG